MMKVLVVPAWLHDVLGERQRWGDLAAIAGFGVGAPLAAVLLFPAVFAAVPLWQAAIAVLLITDIAAGCIANLTSGTNDYYAARPRNRLVFLAVHVHILAAAWLLNLDMAMAGLIWIYTIAGAALVNAQKPGAPQRVSAGVLFALGGSAIALWSAPSPLLGAIGLLFMLKVMVNFAVNHRAETRAQ